MTTMFFYDQKILATLMAQFALLGAAVHPLDTGGFLVSHPQWLHGRFAPDLKGLGAMVTDIGGPQNG